MSDPERQDFESDPLWSERGQLLWWFERRRADDDLLPYARIAAELKIAPAVALIVIRDLATEGVIAGVRGGRAVLWGNLAQVARVRQAEWQRAKAEAARRGTQGSLGDIRKRMVEVLGGRSISVFTLADLYPGRACETLTDELLISVSDPGEAAWLLDRLNQPGPR